MENGREVVAPVLFEDLGNPRLGEVAQSGKSNVWILTCIDEGSAVACGQCISLAKGTAIVELASSAEKPLLQSPRHWDLRCMVKQGAGAKCHHKSRLGMKSRCCREKASAKSMRCRKGARMRGERKTLHQSRRKLVSQTEGRPGTLKGVALGNLDMAHLEP